MSDSPRRRRSGASNELRVVRAEIQRPEAVSEEDASRGVQPQLRLRVEVENPSGSAQHVWSSYRAYEYDASTRVLTVHLSDAAAPVPPGIILISDHPRVPAQVAVAANGRATLNIALPTTIRRRVPGSGLGMSYVEEPIEEVEQVDLHIQYGDEPVQIVGGEEPAAQRERLRAHGRVVRATVAVGGRKE